MIKDDKGKKARCKDERSRKKDLDVLGTQGRRGSSTGDLLVSETRWANRHADDLGKNWCEGREVQVKKKSRWRWREEKILERSERVKERGSPGKEREREEERGRCRVESFEAKTRGKHSTTEYFQ